MGFQEITYLTLVGENVTEYPQKPDQACQAVGVNLVTGFTACRYEFRTQVDDEPCTVVAIYGHNGVLFGAYVFVGRM